MRKKIYSATERELCNDARICVKLSFFTALLNFRLFVYFFVLYIPTNLMREYILPIKLLEHMLVPERNLRWR